METLTPFQIAFFILVMTGAFAVRGGTGFGAAAIAIPILALILPLTITVPVVAVLNVVNSIGTVKRDWRKIAWPDVLRLLPYTLVGIAIGLYLMSGIDEISLARAFGTFLVIFAAYALWTAGNSPDVPDRWRTPLAATTGVVGGFVGALFGGACGAIYAIYLNVLKHDKGVFRVTVTTVLLIGLVARVGGYAGFGLYGKASLIALAMGLPCMLLGSWLGDRVTGCFDQKKFGQLIGWVLMVSGGILILK